MGITRQAFGTTVDGTAVDQYILSNSRGLTARIMTLGGILVGLATPDRDGRLADITLGFDDLPSYLAGNPYFGALVGRYANRIAGGAFALDGVAYRLATNDGPNHLHGGQRGFDKAIWSAQVAETPAAATLTLHHRSDDGDEGYPGTLDATVSYVLGNDTLRLDYTAKTDKPTVLNLSNHTYFNLAGAGDIFGHVLHLPASHFLPVDATMIPTGEVRAVQGTPMDFITPTPIGARLPSDDEQVQLARGGYDHCWVLAGSGDLTLAARAHDPGTGRVLEVLTTQPGVQFYTGNFLDGSLTGRDGRRYDKHTGFCLETQHFPDLPNQSAFPSVVLRPGTTYRQTTVWRFGVA